MNGDNPQTPDPNQAQSPWQYRPDASASPQAAADQGFAAQQPLHAPYEASFVGQSVAAPSQEMVWSASEFIAHEKDIRWYGLFGLAVVLVAAIVYILTRDIFSAVIILGLAALVAYSAGRKPRVITYKIDSHGLTVGERFRPYSDFRSFGIVQEGAFSTVSLAPLKRFAVPLALYYEPKDEDAIIAIISQHLPVEAREHDPIDKLTRRIRF